MEEKKSYKRAVIKQNVDEKYNHNHKNSTGVLVCFTGWRVRGWKNNIIEEREKRQGGKGGGLIQEINFSSYLTEL